METMTMEQLLAQVWAIMTDTEEPEAIAVVIQPAHMLTGLWKSEIISHKCSGPNHFIG